ncbi:rhodanese-like domain-containing protein [Minwuia thermotolerans]|nr:rhodanese-like domain-containing protein [Minwuia thermotolerans]
MSAPELPLEVTVAEAADMRAKGAAIVDVREPWEFDQGHIEDALLIPLKSLPQRVAEVPRDRPVVINCHHGGRSMQAVNYLRQQGFGNVTNMEGGIDRWSLEIDPSIARY